MSPEHPAVDAPASRPIRVAWIIPTLDRGGAEKQLTLLATGIDRQLFEPHVITLTRGGPYRDVLRAAGVPLIEIKKRGKFDVFAAHRLTKTLRRLRPDIVHTWIFAANAYGRWAALRAGVPTVLGGERCVDPWKRSWHHAIDRYLAARTAGILTNSSGVRDFYAGIGVDPAKFTIIPNGISPPAPVAVDRSEALRRFGLPAGCRVLLSVGRLWPQKGYKDLVWAAGMLNVVRPDTVFAIIGDGPQRPLLEQFRDQTGAADAVFFLGERRDIADLLPHCDGYWNGSLYEGQSNAIMEAMQAGLPVVATDIAGNRDLIEHGRSGLLYPAGAVDQLLRQTMRLLEAPELRDSLGQAARQRIAEHFSVDQMVRRHEEYYLAAARDAKS